MYGLLGLGALLNHFQHLAIILPPYKSRREFVTWFMSRTHFITASVGNNVTFSILPPWRPMENRRYRFIHSCTEWPSLPDGNGLRCPLNMCGHRSRSGCLPVLGRNRDLSGQSRNLVTVRLKSHGEVIWDITRRRLVPSYRRFVTDWFDFLTLKMGAIGIPETSVSNNVCCVTSQKCEGFICTAADAWITLNRLV